MNKEELKQYCKRDRRVCPMPPQWAKLESILSKEGGGLKPPDALILGYWFEASDDQKRNQIDAQIDWAEAHGVFEYIHDFLSSLTSKQWYLQGAVK